MDIDEVENILAAPEQKETLKELFALPVKQKTVIYLHYVEGYQIKEIADILGITEGAGSESGGRERTVERSDTGRRRNQ